MKLAWLTDIHLNFVDNNQRKKFYQEIVDTNCNGVLISGDIAEANSVVDILQEMAQYIEKPIYFVLGNHDYYRGTIADVRAEITELTKTNKYLCWLPAVGVKKLIDGVLLVGHDGWADGRLGDYHNSDVSLNDSLMIADLFQEKLLSKDKLLEKMQQLADADARELSNNLAKAIEQCLTKIIILVHVPPFKEACLHQGKISDENWLPYFSCKVLGDVIFDAARTNPNIEFLVCSGHTHSAAHYQPLKNLTVNVGRAEYYHPEIQKVISVPISAEEAVKAMLSIKRVEGISAEMVRESIEEGRR